ncbi:hypothetical protein SAMN05421676_104182 [Salinibacillus kushneri]|uniref:DUF2197 domain-containing protein n=1 Tax=Salinibacillus kushneri TaxID=237682 RepID=A0A1I0DWK1_9BACI|nr:hypothetical protein SAMN05421676_104182 [Salinibacillus kushneri]
MLKTQCFFCKKEYTIDSYDTQYKKLKNNPKSYYVCKTCNQSMQNEAKKGSGINIDDIDKYDKFFR